MDGSMHANNFGTDELIALCKALNSEALITANFGTGTLGETLDWQTYFKNHGLPVKFWEIGNEIYLAAPTMPAPIAGNDARIYKTPAEYSAGFAIWARALRSADPGTMVGAIAGTTNTSAQNQGWLDTLLANAGQDIDFIALHNSFAPLIFTTFDYANGPSLLNAYGAMHAQAANAGEDTLYVRQRLSAVRPESQGKIAITEHFPLFGSGPTLEQLLGVLDQSRTQGSALFTASLFHSYIRQQAFMANYNLATSPWFGALVTQAPGGLVKTPTYYVYDLYRNHFGTTAVGVDVASPTYNSVAIGAVAARAGIAYLDAIASTDSAGRTYLAVVNSSTSSAIDTALSGSGLSPASRPTVYSLQASKVNAINGTGMTTTTVPANITTQISTWKPPASGVFTFPPNSVTILVW
jgi:alpha-L-arabinofuranosidase